jgi:hypothetical protein
VCVHRDTVLFLHARGNLNGFSLSSQSVNTLHFCSENVEPVFNYRINFIIYIYLIFGFFLGVLLLLIILNYMLSYYMHMLLRCNVDSSGLVLLFRSGRLDIQPVADGQGHCFHLSCCWSYELTLVCCFLFHWMTEKKGEHSIPKNFRRNITSSKLWLFLVNFNENSWTFFLY